MKAVRRISGGDRWAKKFTCSECKTVWEVGESDLRVFNHAVFYGGETWEPEVSFLCDDCHTENVVTERIPSGMQYKLINAALAARRRD